MYICEISKPAKGTHSIISCQVTVARMTMHKGFVNLCAVVTTHDDISSKVTVAKMTVHIKLLSLLTAVTTDK